MSFQKKRRKLSRQNEDGYILLILLLVIASMIIFAAAIMPSITFEIKRDREEEMIHRGVQYSRAIRLYYRKFGRYPTKLEDLESTNNMRFLRKRYKDPVAGQEFKLLHFGEARLSLGGAGIPGLTPMANPAGPNASGFQSTAFGGSSFGSASSFGSTSSFGNANSFAGNSFGANSASAQNRQTADQPASTDASQPSPEDGSDSASVVNPATSGKQPQSQIIGGPIIGVVSSSKGSGIREFDHKRKYSEWQFIFDPQIGMSLPTGPNQRPAQFSVQSLAPNSSPGTLGISSPGGLQNYSNGSSTRGLANTNQSGDPVTQPANPQ